MAAVGALYATRILLLLSCFTASEGSNVLWSSPAQLRPGKLPLRAGIPLLHLRGGGMEGLTKWLQNDFSDSFVLFKKSVTENGMVRPSL